jgi:hypothetical protein
MVWKMEMGWPLKTGLTEIGAADMAAVARIF